MANKWKGLDLQGGYWKGLELQKVICGGGVVWEKEQTDADSSTFITAAGLTEQTHKDAINYLVSELKSKGLWQKMIAIYPFVGGNENSHKFNLKNPQDSDAAFRLTFTSVTHSVDGIQYGYSDTKISNANVNYNSVSFGFYSRTNSMNGGTDISASNPSPVARFLIHAGYTDGNAYFDAFNATSERIMVSGIGNSLGLYILSRTANNLLKAYKNGILLGSNTTTRTAVFNGNININILNANRNYAFAFVGSGLSDTDATNLNDIVEQYQTILGRQV